MFELRLAPYLVLLLVTSMTPMAAAAESAETVYVNGTIITMDGRSSIATAMATRAGRFLAVGDEAGVRKLADDATRVVDLEGKVVLPGLYAAHDHFPSSGTVALFQVDLNSPPIGKIENIPQLIDALKAKAQTVPKGQWVTGRGYDDTLLKEGRHPTRYDLDQVSTEHPIWITHTSGHLGVANSRALAIAKVTKDTPQPSGGRIRKDLQTGEPDGVFEETLGSVTNRIKARSQDEQLRATEFAVGQYVSRGVTTSVIASGGQASIGNLERALNKKLLPLRIITMTSGSPDAALRERIKKLGSDRLKVGAIKLLQDGSIQGYTGYLTQPYHKPFMGKASYRGYPLRSRQALTERVKELHRAGYQLAIHANGDAAIDDVLFAYAEAQKDFPREDTRHRIEHCQTPREDQLDLMKSLGVTPSFFVGHVYYWGDRHAAIFLGPERAARISPLRSAVSRSIRFTVHNDTPVTPVNPLLLISDAVNRTTTGGQVLGAEQRVTPEQALRAVTIDAAWQNFEEEIKGSIEAGKLADFVIVDQNPLSIPLTDIPHLQVLETVVGGESVYKR